MSEPQKPAVDFDMEDVCPRFSAIYTGAISDVLDEMGYREQALASSIQGLPLEHRVAGVEMPVEGELTESLDPQEIFISILKMLGDLKPAIVIVSQPHDDARAHLGEFSGESAMFRGARGAVIDGGVAIFTTF